MLVYVLSAYRIAFAGVLEQGRMQCDFAPKNAIHFVSKLMIFRKVESDSVRIWGGLDPVLGILESESGLESDSRPLFKDSDSYSDSCPWDSDS